jgi:type VII secretion protein EssA
MKTFWKRTSVIAALLLGISPIFSLFVFAQTNLDNSGELRLKIERIGEGKVAPEKLEFQDVEETELERIAPGLFKEQTRAAIESRQKGLDETAKQFEDSLFVSPVEQNKMIKDTEKSLFSNEYVVEYYAIPSGNKPQSDDGNVISKEVLAAIFGMVFIICAGIYLLMNKMVK